MGWNSANYIFDPVADALSEDKEPEDVLAILINELIGGDWDTWDESLGDFADNPMVVEAFRRSEVGEEVDQFLRAREEWMR